MADNRKYYYLKLKENFFDSDSIVLLEDMKDGILYSNILFISWECHLNTLLMTIENQVQFRNIVKGICKAKSNN